MKLTELNNIVALAQAVSNRRKAFFGNCGPFAAAMYNYLTAHDIPTGLIYVENDDDEGVGHAAITIEDNIIDGTGIISMTTLMEYGLYDHGSTLDEVNVTSYGPDAVSDDELSYIIRYTDGDASIEEYEHLIKEEALRLGLTQAS